MIAMLVLLLLQEPPEALDDRLAVELVAAEPDIVTPVALDVDAQGRVWVIESNTHFPKNYQGHPTDRILVFHQGKRTVFADGFRYGMSLALRPGGDVWFATRWEIMILREGGEKRTLVKLETKGDYPHNGLCGFAFRGEHAYFGMGENLGVDYRLVGSDGSSISGGGEGGNVFRCRLDGSKVERVATGFWNPFHMCFDARGRLFVVDNDPDSRPPCRLLHVVPGGDYGFKFRNGRKGLHPFTAWNGELPGTLPMVSGTGEAPSGVVAYEAGHLPPEYRGTLLATSWGDHVLQRFALTPKGASFTSSPVNFVRGGENFRPVGMAVGPDGSLYVSDWVDRSYNVHGKGRIWRVRAKTPGTDAREPAAPEDPPALRRMNEVLAAKSTDGLLPLLADSDPFLAHAAVEAVARLADDAYLFKHARAADPKARVGILLAMRRKSEKAYRPEIPEFLADPDPRVRRAAIQWVGEEKLAEFDKAIAATVAQPPVSREVFEAYIAAVGAKDIDQKGTEGVIVKTLDDPAQPPALRALALRMLRRDHPSVAVPRLLGLLEGGEELRGEAVRALSAWPDPAAQEALRKVALDAPVLLREEAVLGLAHSASVPETRALLRRLLDGELREAALQSLAADPESLPIVEKEDPEKAAVARGQDPGGRPADLAGWLKLLAEGGGDPARGRRVFFHPKGPQCALCHRVDGRGGDVGPDLSNVGGSLSRERLIESVVEPSREVAPMFVMWRIRSKDGDVFDGRLLTEDGQSVTLLNARAERVVVKRKDIDERLASTLSLMPEKLPAAMTLREFRDLLAFLESLK